MTSKNNHTEKIRTPVIPGFNDTKEDILSVIEFLKDKPSIHYELLPYHCFGKSKYEALGRDYPMGDAVLDKEKFAKLKNLTEILK